MSTEARERLAEAYARIFVLRELGTVLPDPRWTTRALMACADAILALPMKPRTREDRLRIVDRIERANTYLGVRSKRGKP